MTPTFAAKLELRPIFPNVDVHKIDDLPFKTYSIALTRLLL